jgi:hypothetical protein
VPNHQPLDLVPVLWILALFAIASLVAYEIGFRIGRWWQRRTPGEQEGPTGMLVGSIFGLMAFILAITMGMASDRYDTRRALVLEEANAIRTVYLRAGYLDGTAPERTRELLREYVPLRVAVDDLDQVRANIQRSSELHEGLWAVAEEVARTSERGDVTALYIESLNEVIDLHESRVIAGLYARVPPTILWLLLGGSVLTLAMVGYSAGLSGSRSPLTAIVLIVALGAVITLVIDLDRPRDGFITVSQQPLVDLADEIQSP